VSGRVRVPVVDYGAPLVRWTRDGIRLTRLSDGTGWHAVELVTGAQGYGRTRDEAAEAARRRADCMDYRD
jgi:hypothetical protein